MERCKSFVPARQVAGSWHKGHTCNRPAVRGGRCGTHANQIERQQQRRAAEAAPAPVGTLDSIHPEIRPYAQELLDHGGFTVYAAVNPKLSGILVPPLPLRFFHYSREVDGQAYFGTVTMTEWDGPAVHMPRTPSREHGSAVVVVVAERVTLEAMTKAASPTNTHEWEPGGTLHQNARPWGVPTRYAPITTERTQA